MLKLINIQLKSVRENSTCSHVPVLLQETIKYLNVGPCKVFLDMTFGAGGHTRGILEKAPDAKVYALDRDPYSYKQAKLLSDRYPGQIIPLIGKFSDLPKLFKENGVHQNSIDGIVFDFGCSSLQLSEAERGFSLSKYGPLDMRMSKYCDQITAAKVLATISECDLATILRIYGGEKSAKRIARAVVESRSAGNKIENTKQFADLVSSCIAQTYKLNKFQISTHLATKSFQAIRIFINNELNEINYGIRLAHHFLKTGGRFVTITFHSLEDIIVKRHINGNIIEGLPNPVPLKYNGHNLMYGKYIIESLLKANWKQLHKHVIIPNEKEILMNSRSRSAKLRAAEKLV